MKARDAIVDGNLQEAGQSLKDGNVGKWTFTQPEVIEVTDHDYKNEPLYRLMNAGIEAWR